VVSSFVRDVPAEIFSATGSYPCKTARMADIGVDSLETGLVADGLGSLLGLTRHVKLIPFSGCAYPGKESGDGVEIATSKAATDSNVVAHELGHLVIGDPPPGHANGTHDNTERNLMQERGYGEYRIPANLKDYQCDRADDPPFGSDFFTRVAEPPWVLCDWTGTPGELAAPPSEWFLATFATWARCRLEFDGVIIAECGDSFESCYATRAALGL
jgi:hypothetical protein